MLLPIILFILLNPAPETVQPPTLAPPAAVVESSQVPPVIGGANEVQTTNTVTLKKGDVVGVVVKQPDAQVGPTIYVPNGEPVEVEAKTDLDVETQPVFSERQAVGEVQDSTATTAIPTMIRTPASREQAVHDEHVKSAPIATGTLVNPPATALNTPLVAEIRQNCLAHRNAGNKVSGIYKINPDDLEPFFVWCDMETDGGGWAVVQRRLNGDGEDFYRKNYDAYEQGFGKLDSNLWLGLEYMHRLAPKSDNLHSLRIELRGDTCENCSHLPDGFWWGEWDFALGGRNTGYVLTTSSVPTGGNLTNPTASKIHRRFEQSSGMKFSTTERDQDVDENINCAQFKNYGPWWHRGEEKNNHSGLFHCSAMALNGKYGDNVPDLRHMVFHRDGKVNPYYVKPKQTLMMVRPRV